MEKMLAQEAMRNARKVGFLTGAMHTLSLNAQVLLSMAKEKNANLDIIRAIEAMAEDIETYMNEAKNISEEA